MTRETWPLLCWRLAPDLVLGHVVGLGLERARSDEKKLQRALATELGRTGHWQEPIKKPTLRRIHMSFRPAWRSDEGSFPLADPLQVPVDAVHGENDLGSFTCFLPRLELSFHFYELDRLDTLITHFAQEALSRRNPEEVARFLLAPTPWLETVSVQGRKARRTGTGAKEWPLLSRMAERLPPVGRGTRRPDGQPSAAWERGLELLLLSSRLLQPRSSLLLVGEEGVGKDAILSEAIRRTAPLQDSPTFWRTTAERLVAGARYLGDWQERCDQIAAELEDAAGVLWIEDIVALLRTGGSGPEDSVAAFWTPLLERGKLRLMGTLTPRQLDAARGRLPAFFDRFQVLPVDELGSAEVARVADQFAEWASRSDDLSLEPPARRLALRLLGRYIRDQRFPGKAVRFLADCARHALSEQKRTIDEAAVLERFVARTGMPALLVDDRIPLDPGTLFDAFSAEVIGQPGPVEAVVQAITTFKAGLDDPDRPVATLLFAGPTGVGKTALARTLAQWLYGAGSKELPLVRIDMSELQSPGQVARLIGSTDGDPGELVQKIRARPFSVLLLDEIEKAAPVFFDTLLTVLDEGLLTDALGRVTSFRSCVVIMTTNLGTKSGGSLGFSPDASARTDAEIRAFFRPEFLNRIDRIVHFTGIGPEAAAGIVRKELSELGRREGLRTRRIGLDFGPGLVELLVKEGFDPTYGARALQRVIEQRVVAALGRYLVANPETGGCTLRIDAEGGEIRIGSPRT